MQEGIDYVPRRAAELVVEALADTRIVVVNGARQVGKSTLAEAVLRQVPGGTARFLDRAATRRAAAEDPSWFLNHDGLLLIDEVQRVPDLWLEMKYIVDRDPRPGQFLLTGSARLLSLRSIPDALPGRTETIELWPLSQGEIDGQPDGFVDAAFLIGARLRTDSLLRRGDYVARATRGGFPVAVKRQTSRGRQRFLTGYVADLLSRDVKQVADIEKAAEMQRLLALLAAQMGGILSVNRLSNDLELSVRGTRNYIEILETIFVVKRIPAWTAGATGRTVSAPKVMFVDTGLASHLSRGAVSDARVGGLMENFVLGELARQLTWSDSSAQLYHYRDRDQREVDAILEDNSGAVVGIEVKASESIRSEDFRALRFLRDRLGDRFVAGFVLYCGPDSYSFGDRLTCLPISALWTTVAPDRPPNFWE